MKINLKKKSKKTRKKIKIKKFKSQTANLEIQPQEKIWGTTSCLFHLNEI